MDADGRRVLIDLLCKRVLRPDYENGVLQRNPQIESLKEDYRASLVDRLFTDDDWETACQVVYTWQDQERSMEENTFDKVLTKYRRFPTIEHVDSVFGADRAEMYRSALEIIQDRDQQNKFPDEKYKGPWRKLDLDSTISVVTDVIAPNIDDESAMAVAFSRHMGEIRARRKERIVMDSVDTKSRKQLARSLGIWFPITKELQKWRDCPKTTKLMKELEPIMIKVVRRMKLVRSYLQYIPRRKLTSAAVADLPANIDRMKTYLKGFSRV